MHQEPGLKWLFLDLNSYFASVEQQDNPNLRGKPVAVVPMMSDYTCCIAASYEAKAYGVKTGTPVGEAKKMCPGLRLVLARHDVYVDYHHRIIEEVVKHTPINKIWSIDELSSRLPPDRRTVEKAADVSRRIKEGLWKNIGSHINCSIGVAPNSLLAKLAADMKKPDGLTFINQEDIREKLCSLKLRDIPGIGHNMERRLQKSRIATMEQLWNIPPKHMRKIWGGVQGERMWYWLHGYDFEAPETGNVMIGHSRVLDPDMRGAPGARLMARRLLVKATYRLRRKGYHASILSLGVRTVHDQKWRQEIRIPPAQDPFTFLQHLDELWDAMMQAGSTPRFKKIAVLLMGLKTPAELTEDMFQTRQPETVKKLQKREALASALDSLQNKYQKETVWLGTTPKTISGHVGTKIAFARVPDREEFWG
jgi:DNA polymerase-4